MNFGINVFKSVAELLILNFLFLVMLHTMWRKFVLRLWNPASTELKYDLLNIRSVGSSTRSAPFTFYYCEHHSKVAFSQLFPSNTSVLALIRSNQISLGSLRYRVLIGLHWCLGDYWVIFSDRNNFFQFRFVITRIHKWYWPRFDIIYFGSFYDFFDIDCWIDEKIAEIVWLDLAPKIQDIQFFVPSFMVGYFI